MYDVIVVGAGAAGCVLAARLSDDPGRRVLLVEAGGSDRGLAVRAPAAFAQLIGSARDWDLRTVPQPALDGRSLRWPRGRMLGGSTSMNAQMYVRGQQADFDAWELAGASGWGWESVLPWFARLEGHRGSSGSSLGRGGPQVIDDLRDPNPLTQAFLEAAAQTGLGHGDPSSATFTGAALSPVTQRAGRRWSAADAYLHPVRRRRNLTVLTGTVARRLLVQRGQVVGLEVRRGARLERLPAGEVVLAAGAIGSPHLLQASGIGPGRHLRSVGLDVVHDLPGVGSDLADHLMAITVRGTTVPVSLATAGSPRHLLDYLVRRRGALSSNVAEALALVATDPADVLPDVELVFAPVPYLDHGATPPPGHGYSVGAVLLQPASRGTVRVVSSDPEAAPSVDPAYLSDHDGRDLRTLVRGVEVARRVLDAPAFHHFAGTPLRPARPDDDPVAFVRSQAETIYHPVGTCRIGVDDGAVVDPELRVHGLGGLRVADASVMPRPVRGHTAAATMMVAERAAAMVVEGSSSPLAERWS